MENKKTVLITGATSGIGLSIATRLHKNGFEVFGTSRCPNRYANEFPFELLELDVTSQESVDRCVVQLFSRIKNLDILISNAGTILSGNVEEITIEHASNSLKQIFGVQFGPQKRFYHICAGSGMEKLL
jgi:NADP-dependent 3-hydroxy acid dehydrogenase YdfG